MPDSVIDVAGTKLGYREAGAGATVLFLHGAAGAAWDPLLDRLSDGYRVLAPEHPGFGRGQIPDWMMGVGDVAFFYLDLMQALDLRDVHLVGHGLGGWIARRDRDPQHRPARHRWRCSRPPASRPAKPCSMISSPGRRKSSRAGNFRIPSCAQEWQQAQAKLDIDIALQNRTALARLGWNPRMHNPQLPYWLHRIDVPTLLVWGEDDQVVPFACHKPSQARNPERRAARPAEVRTRAADRARARSRRAARALLSRSTGMKTFFFHLMPYADLDLSYTERHNSAWVTLPNSYFDPAVGQKALCPLHRRARTCRSARLRRHLRERASSDRLRADAGAESDRGRAGAIDQAGEDRDPRSRAAAGEQSGGGGGRVRHARPDERGPDHHRLRARHRDRIFCQRRQSRPIRTDATTRRTS